MKTRQTRREFLRTAALSVAAVGLPRMGKGGENAKPPNIVMIFLDDSGWADFQPYGQR